MAPLPPPRRARWEKGGRSRGATGREARGVMGSVVREGTECGSGRSDNVINPYTFRTQEFTYHTTPARPGVLRGQRSPLLCILEQSFLTYTHLRASTFGFLFNNVCVCDPRNTQEGLISEHEGAGLGLWQKGPAVPVSKQFPPGLLLSAHLTPAVALRSSFSLRCIALGPSTRTHQCPSCQQEPHGAGSKTTSAYCPSTDRIQVS